MRYSKKLKLSSHSRRMRTEAFQRSGTEFDQQEIFIYILYWYKHYTSKQSYNVSIVPALDFVSVHSSVQK